MSPVLYHARRTRSLRPLWLMEEMGVDFTLETIPFKMGDTGGAAYRDINPMQKVPALVDNGEIILESTAIMEYLLARFSPSPFARSINDDDYGAYLQWLHGGEATMGMYMSLLVGHRLLLPENQRNAQIAAWAGANMQAALGLLSQALKTPNSILASGFSAADISVGYVLFVLDMIAMLEELAPQNVQDYWDALSARPAWKRAIARS